mgnify:CR=1 FL=1
MAAAPLIEAARAALVASDLPRSLEECRAALIIQPNRLHLQLLRAHLAARLDHFEEVLPSLPSVTSSALCDPSS